MHAGVIVVRVEFREFRRQEEQIDPLVDYFLQLPGIIEAKNSGCRPIPYLASFVICGSHHVHRMEQTTSVFLATFWSIAINIFLGRRHSEAPLLPLATLLLSCCSDIQKRRQVRDVVGFGNIRTAKNIH